jgi:signal transduction histidine kinase
VLSSLRSRLLATYLLVTGLVLALVGASLVFFLLRNPSAERQITQRLELLASLVSAREDRLPQALSPERIQQTLARVGAPEARAMLFSPQGDLILDSRPEAGQVSEEVLQQAFAASQVTHSSYRDAAGRRWVVLAQPLPSGRILVLAAPRLTLRTLAVLAKDVLLPVLEAGAVALLASVALALIVARWVAGPLQRMVVAAQGVADGDYHGKIPLSGPAEVRSLASAFNEMVEKVGSARQAQRDFVANVSHDLKTPLTAIQGFAQAILDGAAADEEARRHAASVIHAEADRLHRLVEDLLDLARIDAGQMAFSMSPVDLVSVLRTVTERLGLRAAEKGVRLEDRVEALPPIAGDGDRLAQVLTNLLDNAVKHTPSGGVVRATGEVEKGWVLIHIDDTGPGIPPEELSRIFERFYQVDKSRRGDESRGVGLGLAISREIVQAHGGRLSAQSAPGSGSRFTMRLPLPSTVETTPTRRKRGAL